MIQKTYTFIKDGKTNDVYTLSNTLGTEVDILTYGGHILRISTADKFGNFDDVLVGCKNPEDYYGDYPYFGATIGRYGNRIENSKFTVNGKEYILEPNDNGNCLHGGITTPFNRVIWDAEIVENSLVLSHISPDGAGGFPGNLTVKVTFTLTEENELKIEYFAVTDKDTHCNLTNHAYFNLGGQGEDTVLSHELFLKASKITPVDEKLIPHGDYMDITNTPYSFNPPKLLGKDMFSDAKFIKACNGYDLNYCIDKEKEGLEYFGYAYDKKSGRKMECYTTLPGVQLYTGCTTGGFKGKKTYVNHCALCLETQKYPNTPNCETYPSTLLKVGETYNEITVYKFSTVK